MVRAMHLSVIRLGKEIVRAQFEHRDWFENRDFCIQRLKKSLKDSGVEYDRIEPWNPAKQFKSIVVNGSNTRTERPPTQTP
jgi:hypothetical protein